MAYYLDSSAVVKYYVTEPGSAWLREQLAGQQAVFLSEITTVEVAAALGILQRIGRVRPSRRRRFWEEFEQDCTVRYDLVPVVHETIQAASKLCAKYPLRAYDAVQLATALALTAPLDEDGLPLEFISADDTLLAAAKAEGLAVDNPSWHTDRDVRQGEPGNRPQL